MLHQFCTGQIKYLLFASSNITAMPRSGRMSSDILWPTFGPGEGGFVQLRTSIGGHIWLDSYQPQSCQESCLNPLQINMTTLQPKTMNL